MKPTLRLFILGFCAALATTLHICPAQAQYSNVYEIHSLAVSEVNEKISELLAEKKPLPAIETAAKAFGNLNKIAKDSVIPALNFTAIFEVAFDDALVTQTKSTLSMGDVFNFKALPSHTRQHVIYALEQKYSSYFFNLFSLVHRLKYNYALALNMAVEIRQGSTGEIIALENDILGLVSSSLANQFVLKNSKSGIFYAFDFLDVLSSSMPKASFAAEFNALNAKLTELYVKTLANSINPKWAPIKKSKRDGVSLDVLQHAIQSKNAEIVQFISGMEGNKKYVK